MFIYATALFIAAARHRRDGAHGSAGKKGEEKQHTRSFHSWSWPEREKRAPAPQIKRPEKVTQSFLEEYELRPPWLKY